MNTETKVPSPQLLTSAMNQICEVRKHYTTPIDVTYTTYYEHFRQESSPQNDGK